jgi:hypothetical protein
MVGGQSMSPKMVGVDQTDQYLAQMATWARKRELTRGMSVALTKMQAHKDHTFIAEKRRDEEAITSRFVPFVFKL